MAEKFPTKDALPGSGPNPANVKSARNPAFRMIGKFVSQKTRIYRSSLLDNIGLPNIKFKLPSRNWLIFWTITGSFTSNLLYDRYHKNRAQQKWCNLVAHLAEEPLRASMMPRKITIFLAAPPGDSIRAAREHFHEYVKPILVAGALDWDVIEGRKEGEVRAGLAEKIRRLRKRNGEKPQMENSEENPEDESKEQLLYELRQKTGISEWNGVQGDLVLGRHTWKEYIRGLHEGWLGPLYPAEPPQSTAEEFQLSGTPTPEVIPGDTATSDAASESPPLIDPPAPDPPAAKPPKTSPTPPYITPSHYPSCGISPLIDSSMNPSLPLPLPHLLGFLNTPTRLYRFLTRRQMAESTGRSVAALVIASQFRPYAQSAEFASAVDPDDASPTAGNSPEVESVALSRETWEQEAVLKQQEKEWHKSAWKANEEGDHRERVWQEPMVIDSRIGQRMSQFELASGEEEKAILVDAHKRLKAGGVEKVRNWTGWTETEKKGWEMGLEGNESD